MVERVPYKRVILVQLKTWLPGVFMDESVCRAYVNKHIKGLMKEFGIPHWKITICYGECDTQGALGTCFSNEDYDRATITLNPQLILDEKELDMVLSHEMLHILHSPFDTFWGSVWDAVKNNTELTDTLRGVHANCKERTVKNLERLVYGIRQSNARDARKPHPRAVKRTGS